MSRIRLPYAAAVFAPLLLFTVGLVGCHGGGAERSSADAAGTKGVSTLDGAVAGETGATAGHTGAAGGTGGHAEASYPAGDPWARWPMPNARLPRLPHPHSYDTSTPEVVVDRVTGLMWQRELPQKFYTFAEAGRHCANLDLGEHSDWRLPSRIELVSLLDTTRIQPSIETEIFPNTPNDWFWTSSPAAGDPNAAWYVYFYFGYPKTDDKSSQFSVRCVRSPHRPANQPPRYRVAKGEVADLDTGLHWQRATSAQTLTFDGAHALCAHLSADGKRGWRVPTLGELLTLIDERVSSTPMINRDAFPETPGEPFWTSSRFVNGPDRAWYVRFDSGAGLYGRVIESFRVRCVRD